MIYDVEAGGRIRRVDISGAAGAPRIVLDGKHIRVDAARFAHVWSLIVDKEAGAGRYQRHSYEVAIVEETAGSFTVHVNGRPYSVSVRTARSGGVRVPGGVAPTIESRPPSAADARGPRRVTAPMPGRIAKILVKVGDAVAARQGLVVIEAMKMENELRSPIAGRVTELRASEGALVEANAVLVVVE